jgi:hypothetical protein
MKRLFPIITLAIIAALPFPPARGMLNISSSAQTHQSTVACRVLEAHSSEQPAVTVVVFHQGDKQDQAVLSSLLQQHSGERVDVEANGEKWQTASVVRLKSCFGRGLLLLPNGTLQLKDGDDFFLRFSTD